MPSRLDLTPEAALLLASINVSRTPQEKSQQIAALVRQPIDWDRFVLLVSSHNLASQVCPHLRPELGIPVQAFAPLRLLDLSNIAKTQLYSAELARLIGLFTTAGIPTVVLKGPALSLLAYGNVSSRDYSDLDILVHPSDVVSASELLIASGYGVNTYNREVYESGFFHNKSFNFMSDQCTVDLHWRIQDHAFPYGPDEEAIWSRTVKLCISGREIQTLSAADYLLYLSVHSAKHGWPTIAHVLDIVALLKANNDPDLSHALKTACDGGFGRMVRTSLALADRCKDSGTELRSANISPSDKKFARPANSIWARLLRPCERLTTSARWRTALSTLDSNLSVVAIILRHMFVPIAEDYSYLALPDPLYPLYYLLRPIRLMISRI